MLNTESEQCRYYDN